jgi:F-type H+-transporting ATPase subunit a
VNVDTIIETLIVMAIILGMALYVRRVVTQDIPGFVQNVFEYLVDFVDNLVRNNLGEHGPRIAPMLLALFVFILLSNWLGLLPLPGIAKSPTADVNTPVALALVSITMVHALALRRRGIRYFGHYAAPFGPRNPLLKLPMDILRALLVEIPGEIARPLSLSLRLFGNIFAGELLLILMYNLIPWWGLALPNALWVFFSILVGIIQAFIFTLLTCVYVNLVAAEGH